MHKLEMLRLLQMYFGSLRRQLDVDEITKQTDLSPRDAADVAEAVQFLMELPFEKLVDL